MQDCCFSFKKKNCYQCRSCKAMLKAFLEKPVRGMDLLKCYSLDRKYWKFLGGHRKIVRIYSRK